MKVIYRGVDGFDVINSSFELLIIFERNYLFLPKANCENQLICAHKLDKIIFKFHS